jgi:hypothetical protein
MAMRTFAVEGSPPEGSLRVALGTPLIDHSVAALSFSARQIIDESPRRELVSRLPKPMPSIRMEQRILDGTRRVL